MISNQTLKQYFLLIFIIELGYLITSNLFLIGNSILGAIMLFVLSRRPIYFFMRKGIHRSKAQWIYLFLTILITLVPLLVVIYIIEHNINSVIQSAISYRESIELIGTKIQEKTGFNLFSQESIKSVGLKISQWIPTILNSTFNLLTTLGVMFFLLFFLIHDGKKMQKSLISLLPINQDNQQKLLKLIYTSVLTNAIMIPLIALIQAIVSWISYVIAGVPNSFIWFLATFATSMLPFVGGALIYIPLGVFTFFIGHQGAGIFIVLWGIIVVSASDNFWRIYFLKKLDNTHPLITFFGVIVGLNLFGFLGLIYGPLLISLFLILINIYKAEYAN